MCCGDVGIEDREVAADGRLAQERHEREVATLAEKPGIVVLRDSGTRTFRIRALTEGNRTEHSHGDRLTRRAVEDAEVEYLARREPLVRERCTLQRYGPYVARDPRRLRHRSRNRNPVRDVVVYCKVLRAQAVIRVEVRFVANLDPLEDDPGLDDSRRREGLDDRLGHVDRIRDIVRAKVHSPRHARTGWEEARELVVPIADRDVRRLGEWSDGIWRRELVLVDRDGWGPKRLVL